MERRKEGHIYALLLMRRGEMEKSNKGFGYVFPVPTTAFYSIA
jgi:hypothetical protein